jgi:hypothetical protein
MCVTNGILLGSSLLLPVCTVNPVQTLKVLAPPITVVVVICVLFYGALVDGAVAVHCDAFSVHCDAFSVPRMPLGPAHIGVVPACLQCLDAIYSVNW